MKRVVLTREGEILRSRHRCHTTWTELDGHLVPGYHLDCLGTDIGGFKRGKWGREGKEKENERLSKLPTESGMKAIDDFIKTTLTSPYQCNEELKSDHSLYRVVLYCNESPRTIILVNAKTV